MIEQAQISVIPSVVEGPGWALKVLNPAFRFSFQGGPAPLPLPGFSPQSIRGSFAYAHSRVRKSKSEIQNAEFKMQNSKLMWRFARHSSFMIFVPPAHPGPSTSLGMTRDRSLQNLPTEISNAPQFCVQDDGRALNTSSQSHPDFSIRPRSRRRTLRYSLTRSRNASSDSAGMPSR